MNDSGITVVRKPEWISWNDIHSFLAAAHQDNIQKGVLMRSQSLSGQEIEAFFANGGQMLTAVEGDKLVGTAAFVPMESKLWCCKGLCLYYCMAAVSPACRGKGVYKLLCDYRDRIASDLGADLVFFDTHEKNDREIDIARRHGFIPVGIKKFSDHDNIVLARWPKGCPYSPLRCKANYLWHKFSVSLKYRLKHLFSV